MLKKRTRISDLFPILLFLIFTLCALGVVLISAQLYRSIVNRSGSVLDADIASNYMIEKFRSHDEIGKIEIAEFNGHDAVKLRQNRYGEAFVTCIYAYEGYLREIYVKEDELNSCDAGSGEAILEVKDMNIEKLTDNILKFNFVGTDNNISNAVISFKCAGNEGGVK